MKKGFAVASLIVAAVIVTAIAFALASFAIYRDAREADWGLFGDDFGEDYARAATEFFGTLSYQIPVGVTVSPEGDYLLLFPSCYQGGVSSVTVSSGEREVWGIRSSTANTLGGVTIGTAPPGFSTDRPLKLDLARERLSFLVIGGEGMGIGLAKVDPDDLRPGFVLLAGEVTTDLNLGSVPVADFLALPCPAQDVVTGTSTR